MDSTDSPACTCDEPDADPYTCPAEPEDCNGDFPELNPRAGAPVIERHANICRTCRTCGWETSVWHVDDGSAEVELHGHTLVEHDGKYAPRAR